MSEKENNHNQDKPPIITELESALNELKEYNSKHTGMGGALNRIIKSVVSNDEDPTPEAVIDYDINLNSPESDAEAELSEELTSFNVSPVFNKIGLDLYDQEKLSAINSTDATKIPSKLGLYVSDVKQFVDFVDNNSEDIAKNQHVLKMIKDIYNSILKDIERTDGDYRNGLLKDLADINEAVESINFGNDRPNFEQGKAYINWGNRTEFDDYLESRKLGLTNGASFDAHMWHIDSPKESLEKKWLDLLSYYKKISRKYEEKNDLVLLMKMEIKEALESLNQWAKNPPENYKENEAYMTDINETIKIINAKAKELHF